MQNSEANAAKLNDDGFIELSKVQSKGLAAAITAGTATDADDDKIEDGVIVRQINRLIDLAHERPTTGATYEFRRSADFYLTPDSITPTLPLEVEASVSSNIEDSFRVASRTQKVEVSFEPTPVLVVDPEKIELDEKNNADSPSTTDGELTLKLKHPTTGMPLVAGDYIQIDYKSAAGPASGATADNTATEGTDYRAEDSNLFITPGITEITVPVRALADDDNEKEELYRVNFWARGSCNQATLEDTGRQ